MNLKESRRELRTLQVVSSQFGNPSQYKVVSETEMRKLVTAILT